MKMLRLVGKILKSIVGWDEKAGRKEFWSCFFSILFVIAITGMGVIFFVVYGKSNGTNPKLERVEFLLLWVCINFYVFLWTIFPSMFLRRLNDAGCSKWFLLLLLPTYGIYAEPICSKIVDYQLGDYYNDFQNVMVLSWLAIFTIACMETKKTGS